ncbi:MAG TPA: DNA-processing protein DprA [Promineifilum sp.]|nr:DNA-processing protein DprA [Promineifilum sp.]HRO24309.1 DNA-processing protein DprA [Promineifilum sp.]HRO91700.1 DNA-processing protein DprA [Promineifilum sp.]HRQ12084.1 DNA-processing protein DprA [Promineifilum sp.]
MTELKYWLGFNYVSGIGPAKIQALLGYFNTLEKAWNASDEQLRDIGFDIRAIQSLNEVRQNFDLDQYVRQVETSGVGVVTWGSPEYPELLREIPAAPPLIFLRGQLEPIDRWAMAVVGTRRLTAYGRQVTRDLVAGLVVNGITVVSGLARGIDAVAHRTALEDGGRTIAVMASGIDKVYPPEHRDLAREIVAGRGAIISDYPFGAEPESSHFPARNRLISGLSLGVIVIEAGERSGALITARFALEQNREVFAVPGNIHSPVSVGTNRLIQQGGKLVMRVEDILEELNLRMAAEQAVAQVVLPETAEEAALISQLSSQPIHVDELGRLTGMPMSLISSTLTMMELKGMVQQVGGMNYIRLREEGPIYNAGTASGQE